MKIQMKRKGYFKGYSIETKLMIMFFFIGFLLFSTIAFLFFGNISKSIDSMAYEQMSTLARETADKVDRFLQERYADIEVIAQSPIISNNTLKPKVVLEYLDNIRLAYDTYNSIAIFSPSGNVRMISGQLDNVNLVRSWLPKVTNSVFVSDFNSLPQSRSYVMYFAAPIISGKGSKEGVVVAEMNSYAISQIVNNVHFGQSGDAYLLDGKGQGIPPSHNTVNEILNLQSDSLANMIQFQQYGVDYVASFYPLQAYPTQMEKWYILIKQPSVEVFQLTNQIRNYTFTLIFIALGIASLFGMFFAKSLVQPMHALAAKTQDIAKGEFFEFIPVEGGDEVAKLALSFNSLLSNLKGMMERVLEMSGEALSLNDLRKYESKIIDDVPTGVVIVDHGGKISSFNEIAETICGIKREVLLSRNIKDPALFTMLEDTRYPKNLRLIFECLLNTYQGGVIYVRHILKTAGDMADEVPFVLTTSAQKRKDGSILGVIGIFRRLDELAHFEQSVARAKNLATLGTLSAGVAHELKNPLALIKGYAQYVQTELGSGHALHSDMSVIVTGVDRMNNILQRFLSFGRPEEPVLRFMNVHEILNTIITMIRLEAENTGIQIRTLYAELPNIPLDALQMQEALLNVVLNALQAMPHGGVLMIETVYCPENRSVKILITDTGEGILQQNAEKLFDPFFTTKEKGTGLGLAITARIVENHKGVVEVTSQSGSGTIFIITLPVEMM